MAHRKRRSGNPDQVSPKGPCPDAPGFFNSAPGPWTRAQRPNVQMIAKQLHARQKILQAAAGASRFLQGNDRYLWHSGGSHISAIMRAYALRSLRYFTIRRLNSKGRKWPVRRRISRSGRTILVGLSIANLGNEIQAGLDLLSRFCSYVNTLTTEGSEWQRSGGRGSGDVE